MRVKSRATCNCNRSWDEHVLGWECGCGCVNTPNCKYARYPRTNTNTNTITRSNIQHPTFNMEKYAPACRSNPTESGALVRLLRLFLLTFPPLHHGWISPTSQAERTPHHEKQMFTFVVPVPVPGSHPLQLCMVRHTASQPT